MGIKVEAAAYNINRYTYRTKTIFISTACT